MNLQRVQLWVAILAGTATFIVGAYQIKNIFFSKKEIAPVVIPASRTSPIRSAVEDTGAEWIKKLGKPKESSTGQ